VDVTVASFEEMEPIFDGIARRARASLGVPSLAARGEERVCLDTKPLDQVAEALEDCAVIEPVGVFDEKLIVALDHPVTDGGYELTSSYSTDGINLVAV